MRKGGYILIVLAAYLLLCSKSCGSDNGDNAELQKNRIRKTKELIRAEAESEILSDQSLRAYEANAKQKLADFADYLTIYYNTGLEQPMRDQARLMIADLFTSGDIVLAPFTRIGNSAGQFTLTEMLSEDYLPEYPTTKILFDSIAVVEPLKYSGESVYTGILSFYCRVKSVSGNDTLVSERGKMEAEMLVKKVNKTFGDENLKVWGVYLGNMRPAKQD